jgi:NADH-quinone oxidoreductase subunit J
MSAALLAQQVNEQVVSTGETVAFWFLAPIAVIAALGMLVMRKAVHSALMLAVTMICLAVLYLGQDAPFLGVVQIVVYTGAVMMLFLFVLMLVGVDSSDSLVETLRGQRLAGMLAGVGFALLLVSGIADVVLDDVVGLADANAGGNVEAIAALLFVRYAFVFEVTGTLLITATLAGMVLTHRERHERRASQRELSEARFRPGGYSTPLPPPGVFARHNAVDTPALLPDGTPSELSVPRTLSARGDVRSAAPVAGTVAALEAGMEAAHDDVRVGPPAPDSAGPDGARPTPSGPGTEES